MQVNCPKCSADISDTFEPADPSIGIMCGTWYCDTCDHPVGEHDVVDEGLPDDVQMCAARDPGEPIMPENDNEPMLQFFAYAHLPEHLQTISRPFGELAEHMVKTLPRNPERTAGLRKLLEAKDCAVRAQLYK